MIACILPHIYRIEIPLPNNPLKRLNSYLIQGEDRSLLIDTGFRQEPCRLALQEALDTLGVERDSLDIFGTHIHSDHIGLVDEFVGKNRHIYLGEGDFLWTSSKESQRYWDIMDIRFLEEGFPAEELLALHKSNPARNFGPQLDLPNYTCVHHGDSFDIAGYHIEVLAAPGHTPGMVCLWIAQEGILFTADHILFDITPNITMWPNMPNSLGTYLQSLRRFAKLPVRRALPSHRETGDYFARIDALLLHHKNRVQESEDIVRAHPNWTTYEIAGKMTWAIRAKNWAEFPLIQKWFAVGEAQAHLDYLCQEKRIQQVTVQGIHRYLPL